MDHKVAFTLSVSDSIAENKFLSDARYGNGYSTHSLAKPLVKICHFPACITIAKDFANPVWMVPLIIFSSHFFHETNTQCERSPRLQRFLLFVPNIHTFTVADPGFSPGGGAPTPKSAIIFQFFAENCMKMKEFGPPGGARVPGAPRGSANAFTWLQQSLLQAVRFLHWWIDINPMKTLLLL